MFGLKKSNKGVTARKLYIENLEERIECATKVWNGSFVSGGTNAVLGPPVDYGNNGDPTFSSFMATAGPSSGILGNALGGNWDPTLGQTSLPQNGDTLVFPLIAAAQLATPTAGVFGNLTRIDTSATPVGPPPGPIQVNLINDLSPDASGNLPGYLRDSVTGANYFNPLVYVDAIQFDGAGYYMYGRDNPQFGPFNRRISPINTFPTTITAEFFYPGATNDNTTPFFDPFTYRRNGLSTALVYVDPATVDPVTNISFNPAVPLNIQTQMVANYAGSSLVNPTDTSAGNANWVYSPINAGNPNAPAGSSFVFKVAQEGSWLILDSDISEASTTDRDGGYVLLNDVNNNKIVKQGSGILVFECNNGYTGSTSVEQGLLIVSDSAGLGSALTNSNVDVSNGTLMLSVDQYGTNSGGGLRVRNRSSIVIDNRNLLLLGGDGYRPLTQFEINYPVYVPFGEFTGRDSRLGFGDLPHQWNGTVTLNSNPSEVTTSLTADPYGITAPIDPLVLTSGVPANPTGDPSVGQEFASITDINGVISGIAGLRKWGEGVVELTQANTFSGDVVIFDGFLNAQNNTALGPVSTPKNIIVRELPANLIPASYTSQQLAGALTLGDEVSGGQNLVFGSQYNLILQDGNTSTVSNNGPDQNPSTPLSQGTRVEGLGAFQVVSPNNNPNFAEWQGGVNVQTNASIGGTPDSTLLISGTVSAITGVTLEKRGSMIVGISANNSSTFTGSWLVSNGDLQVMNNNALGAATLVSVTQLSPVLPALSGAGSIQVTGSGLNILTNVSIQGTGFNGFGALQSIGQNTWSGIITVAGTTSLGAGAGSELIVGGQITQAAGIPASSQLIKIGAGTVVVSKAQTSLNLPISVQEGTLLVQSPGNLGIGTNQVTVSTSVPVNSATLALDGGITISNRTLNLDGTGVAGAGALRSISGNNTWSGNVNLAGTMQLAYVGVDTGTLTLSGKINGGSSTLQKTGAGTLIISGSGNNQGSTVVGAGTVYQIGQDNVPVFVNTSGTLQGSGRIGVLNMTAGQNGTVTPGTQTSSVAVLTTSGISAQSSVGVFSFDLNTSGTIAGTAYDQIAVNGNVNLSGRPVLDVNLNFAPTARGTSYTIINNDLSDPVVGTFNGQAEGSLVTALDTAGNSVSYRISYVGGTGNDVTLTCVGVLTTNILTSSDVDNLTQYGDAVTFTSTISAVSGTVTSGTVTYFDQGVSIGQVSVVNGVATFTTATLNVNGSPHVITSTFVGQGIFGDSNSNIIAQSVNKSSSSVTVTTNSQVYGTNLPLTVTATVTPQYAGGSATGQVLIRIDGVIQPLQTISTTVTDPTTGATTATLLTSISTTGFHTIDALYLGDSNVNGSAFSPIFNQQILTTAITTLGLVSSRNPADRLATITFTASVTNPIIPAESTIGLVQFLDNGVALGAPIAVSNNVATYSTSTLTGGRHTITANYLGSPNGSNTRYFSSSTGTIYQAITATSNLVITGTNVGGGPQVNVYNLLTQETTSFFAFAPSFRGGVRVASGDVTGDGIADVVVAAGPGGGPQVNVYDGTNLELVHSFYAYNAAFDDGIFIAVGDVNGDGYADIITGAGQGGGPHVQVFSGQNYSNIASFFAYNPVFTGGISVASGDVNGDGYSDVVVGAGPGGGPHVLAVSGLQLSQGTQVVLASFFAFDPGINQGVFVGAGDYNGDIVADIVVAAGPGGGPHVKVFNGSGTSLIDTFFAYDINFAGGLSVAMADINNDGVAEIVTAPYTNGGPEVKVFRYQKGQLYNFYAYDPLFTGGVFVG
jgi:autotransporter-associated beta strand protein